jgi:hypothetical protein
MTEKRRWIAAMAVCLFVFFLGVLLTNTAAVETTSRQKVLDHVSAVFGMYAHAVEILELPPRDLPAGAAEFYVEAKGSHGHNNHSCILMGDKCYCSGVDGEFTRLLREQSLLDSNNLAAAQLMRLYALLALPRQIKYIDATGLTRNAQSYRAFPDVAVPTLSRSPDEGLTLTFYATPVETVDPSRWTVTITRDYQIEVASQPLAPH